jgi:hypothetical protein
MHHYSIDQNFMTQVSNCFLPIASVYGYTLRITAGFRSMAEQTAMYEQGLAELQPAVL